MYLILFLGKQLGPLDINLCICIGINSQLVSKGAGRAPISLEISKKCPIYNLAKPTSCP